MRRFLIGSLFFFGLLFIYNYFSELESVFDVARQGAWQFFGLAIVAEVFWLGATGATYWAIYRAMAVERPFRPFIAIASASNFVNTVAPTGGVSSLAVLIADAKRNKYPGAYATVAQALFVFIEYMGFTIFLVIGIFSLLRTDTLTRTEIVAASLYWLSAIGLAALLYLGSVSERRLAAASRRLISIINKMAYPFIKRTWLDVSRGDDFANKISEGLVEVRKEPRKLFLAILASAASKACMMLVLLLMFYAFNIPPRISTLFASFSLAYLFLIISPTPAGIGIVEGVLTLGLTSLAVPLSAAALIVLGYRAITFWLRLFVGMILVQQFSLQSPDQGRN
jgi:hypothetical protein